MNHKILIKNAIRVVDAFDQANTGKAVEKLGERGLRLQSVVEGLRKILNADKKMTTLTAEQANE
jgi:hypothetical protein